LKFCTFLREQPNAVLITPGERHWAIFTDLCTRAKVRGDLAADAFLAAMAIESGCEWITIDRDYARFPGLRWRHPF
jgi:predicted nucleic acid-binding protein